MEGIMAFSWHSMEKKSTRILYLLYIKYKLLVIFLISSLDSLISAV